ncbi:MAG: hypothetical protein ACE5H9_12960, partial [Anaerolineae bacterium]
MIRDQALERSDVQNARGRLEQFTLRQELLLAAAAYAALAFIVTWPVVARLADAVGGFDGRDSFQHVWLFWWFWEALLNKAQLPAQVDVLYFPQGASHPVLWLHPLLPLAGLPLTGSLGPTVTYNLLLLLSFVLAGAAGYLLARPLARQPQAAFIGGLIFAFAPTRMGHTLAGHQLLSFNFALPLYALALWLWLKRPSRRVSGLYTVALVLVLLSHPNFVGYFLLPVTLILIGAYWRQRGRFSRGQLQQLALSWIIAGLAFLPFAWPMLVEYTGRNLTYLQPKDRGEHSADLASFATPSPFHPLWGDNAPAITTLALDRPRALEEGFNYLGLAALGLAGVAVWRRRAQAGPWLVMAVVAGLFSLGPVLKIGGQATGLWMPYTLLLDLPFFAWSRTPGRLNMTTMMALSVLSALGMACILRHCRRQLCRWGLLAGLAGFIVVEYVGVWPFPTDARPISTYYASTTGSGLGLLEMPVTGSRRASNYAMYYQTVHRQPLVGGYIERDPPGTRELSLFADRLLSPPRFDPAAISTPSPAQRIAILGALEVTDVVAHPALLTDRAARATLSFMPELLGEPYFRDDELIAWRAPAAETALPAYALLLAEKGWEPANDPALVRLRQESLLFVYAAQPGPAVLSVELPGQASANLWIDDAGPFPVNGEPVRHEVPLQLRAGLNWIPVRATDCDDC